MRRVREKKAQRETNAWYDFCFPDARTTLTLRGRKGWPDEIYWIPGGKPFLIEFKADGEEPRKLQSYIHEQLRKRGYDVEVHTSSAEAVAAIKQRLKAMPKVQKDKASK